MESLFIFLGTIILACMFFVFAGMMCMQLFMLLTCLVDAATPSSFRDDKQVLIKIKKPRLKATGGQQHVRQDDGVSEAARFFEDVRGVDLEYRGVGVDKGSS